MCSEKLEIEKKSKTGPPERGNFSNKTEFLLSCLGYCIGFGNIWRFPFQCYENGGGAFLIPYFLALFLCGMPIFVLELSLGQYSQLGPHKLFANICPAFAGVGLAMIVVSFLTCIYFNMIMAWATFYMWNSFRKVMPWEHCDNSWNSANCFDTFEAMKCSTNETFFNQTCIPNDKISNGVIEALKNFTPTSPAESYFNNRMLQISDGIWNLNGLQWELVLALFLCWVTVFFCIIKGIKSSGKVVYFSALFPYVMVFVLLIRGVTLPGAIDGIKWYIVPKWEKLAEIKVWKDAIVQIFYSLGPAFGSLITLASYSRYNNNCVRDAIFISITNCLTSLVCGFAIFSVIGFMAKEMNTDINEVVKDGLGLAFIAYPTALSRIAIPQLWSVLFFLMIFFIGIDSQFVMVETVLTYLLDKYPKQARKHKSYVVFALCTILFLLGLFQCTRSGLYIFNLIQDTAAGWVLLVICTSECLIIAYVYGAANFKKDIEFMIGRRISPWWAFNWKYVTPAMLISILVIVLIDLTPISYGAYAYPQSANNVGYFLSAASIMFIPLYFILSFIRLICYKKFTLKAVKDLFRPTQRWYECVKFTDVNDDDDNDSIELKRQKSLIKTPNNLCLNCSNNSNKLSYCLNPTSDEHNRTDQAGKDSSRFCCCVIRDDKRSKTSAKQNHEICRR